MFKRINLMFQEVLAYFEEKLGLHDDFENTIDRWERKGLVRRIDNPRKVQKFRREDVQHLRRETWDDVLEETRDEPPGMWDDIADAALAQLETSPMEQPARARAHLKPDRRRLRRLYRWQLREARRTGQQPRADWDELFEPPPTAIQG